MSPRIHRTGTKPVMLVTIAALLLAMTMSASAQQPLPHPTEGAAVQSEPPFGPDVLVKFQGAGAPAQTIEWVSLEMAHAGKVIQGAPYAAEAVTSMVQTLADGNRIASRVTAAVYRDAVGRTRREDGVESTNDGAAEEARTVLIHDPVAGQQYILHPASRRATRFALPGQLGNAHMEMRKPLTGGGVAHEPRDEKVLVRRIEKLASHHGGAPFDIGMGHMRMMMPGIVKSWMPAAPPTKESMGNQLIEGVEAEGTRSTVVIPAGAIGNERAIEIVSEQWYSPELQLVILSRHTDPRFGETTYSLTNLRRGDQPRWLFELPADYTISDDPPGRFFTRELK
jgi:hypothetical protein